MITVTKPFFPPIEEFFGYIRQVYDNCRLTNNGPLLVELEEKLKSKLDVPHLLITANGTIALQMAIRALGLRGEIITTPFTYIATTSSILWQHCTPVFADIDPATLNLYPGNIEAVITPQTTAILATHVFGNACEIDALQKIADKHGLKLIFDGAHCFATTWHGKSVFNFGDISTVSFHATKLFNTGEGGAVITRSSELKTRLEFHRNFGHNGPGIFADVGINGKNSELHAAFGLANLPYVDAIVQRFREIAERYDSFLIDSPLRKQKITSGCGFNYAYYPVIFPSETQLLRTFNLLEGNQIYTRRYFSPSLNTLHFVQGESTPISEDISQRILCLPVFFNLTDDDIENICTVLKKSWE